MSKKQFVFLIIFLTIIAFGYYYLVARPNIKANCLNAATRVVDGGDRVVIYGDKPPTKQGEEVVFDQSKYDSCIK